MNQENTSNDLLQTDTASQPTLPGSLNVLTILTFIGCAIGFLGAVWNFFNAEKNFRNLDKLREQLKSDSMPGWAKALMGDPEKLETTITKSFENRLPILLLTLVAVGLCFYGALQMRKLKKQGYPLYLAGELLPFLTQGIFIGFFTFSGVGFMIGVAITLLFILMYTLNRKSLVY